MSALLQRKTMSALYPQIGHVFANLPHKPALAAAASLKTATDEEGEEQDNLLINVIEEGNSMLQSLQILNLQPQVCLRDRVGDAGSPRPINLYHKVRPDVCQCQLAAIIVRQICKITPLQSGFCSRFALTNVSQSLHRWAMANLTCTSSTHPETPRN